MFTHGVQQWGCLSDLKKAKDDNVDGVAHVPALRIEDLRHVIDDLFSPVIKAEFSSLDDAVVVG